MTTIAILRNWDEDNRRAGTAFITLVNTDGANGTETVTVGKRQSAKAALEVAGWRPVSGVRTNRNGQPTVLVQRITRRGLAEAALRMSALVAPVIDSR